MEHEKKVNLFDTLEGRLDKILEGFTAIREERQSVITELQAKQEEVKRLKEEISLLKNERVDVRNRIERLIARLEGVPLDT
jgi:uncharacterized coiled-coil DUF342 family protein